MADVPARAEAIDPAWLIERRREEQWDAARVLGVTDVRFLDFSAKPQKMGGDKLKLVAPVKNGIDSDNAKKIQSAIKASKLKVQASIQGDTVRVTGGKRDDLQAAIALLRKDIALPLAFQNFRD